MTTAVNLPDVMGRPVTLQDMLDRDKLMTIDDGRAILETTEPLAFIDFQTGPSLTFDIRDGWNNGFSSKSGTDPVEVFVNISHGSNDGREFQLTKDAVLEAGKLCHLTKKNLELSPGWLTTEAMNYWFSTGLDRDLRFMVVGEDQLVMAMTRGTVQPFSNVELLDRAVARVLDHFPGVSVYLDRSKIVHSLRRTYMQLVIPELSRSLTNTGVDNDSWWGGIQISNSQSAEIQTAISGFLYRILCTNGMIDMGASADSWSRRSGGQNLEDVYAWAQEAVDEVLGGLEHSFDRVQSLVDVPLEGEIGLAARDIFEQHRVPVRARQRIIDQLVETDQLNMYGLVNAITSAANDEGIPFTEQQLLMGVGGEIAGHAERCDACHRLIPEGLVAAQ